MYGFPINLIVFLFPAVRRRPRAPQPCRILPPLTFQKYNPRIAHLVGEYRHDPASARFSDLCSPEILLYRPQVLSGSGTLLCRLARAIIQGTQRPVPLRYAVVAQHRNLEDLLLPQQRELLWRVFQVPIFEQICTAQGQLLASECEVHDGLHIADKRVAIAAGEHWLLSEPCACGVPGLRLAPYREPAFVEAPLEAAGMRRAC